MKWLLVAAAALVAVVAVNVFLLAYGADRHDPVGRLSPVTTLPVTQPAPGATAHREREDD